MSRLRRELWYLLAALTFFTRLPMPRAADVTGDDLKRARRYFPAVGILIGAIGALAWWLARLVLPDDIAVLISMAATILATGAFHEDGFTDVCDGFGGGYDRERVLEIMNDSRVGAFGVIGIALLLALKATALMHVPVVGMIFVLIAAHAVSRLAAVTLMATHEYVRNEPTAKARPVAAPLSGADWIVASVFGLAPMIALPLRFAWTLVVVIFARAILGRWFQRRIDGYTGDCLGATQQICEVIFYLSIVALV